MTTATATPMTINTKHATRRELHIGSLDELRAELDRIEAGQSAGTLQTTGNWTPGQNLRHLAIFFRASLDGFPPGKPPAVLRWFVRVLFKKRAIAGKPAMPGFKLPAQFAWLEPSETTFEEGVSELRACLRRVEAGERMEQPSPVIGPLTHDEWIGVHCGHCSMHLSFLYPEGVQ
jgi:hypothetical protein